VHDNPATALSDGSNALPLNEFRPLLEKIKCLGALTREWDAPVAAGESPNVSARVSTKR